MAKCRGRAIWDATGNAGHSCPVVPSVNAQISLPAPFSGTLLGACPARSSPLWTLVSGVCTPWARASSRASSGPEESPPLHRLLHPSRGQGPSLVSLCALLTQASSHVPASLHSVSVPLSSVMNATRDPAFPHQGNRDQEWGCWVPPAAPHPSRGSHGPSPLSCGQVHVLGCQWSGGALDH